MCSGTFSSRIELDPVHNQWASWGLPADAGADAEWFRSPEVVRNHLLQHPEEIDWLEFQGGETLLAKEVTAILQYLIDVNAASHIEIGAVTNATTTRSSWLKLVERFKRLHLTISVDGFGKYYEYIRYPGRWNALVRNIEILRQLPNTSTQVHITLQNYNALSLVELCRYLDSIEMDFYINPLADPAYLNATTMPPAARWLAAERLQNYLKKDCRPQNRDVIQGMIGHLEQPGEELNPELLHEFMVFTNDLDVSRKQSFAETHAELLELIRQAGLEWTSETRYAKLVGTHSLTVLPGGEVSDPSRTV
jgi:glutamate-1-semialdehyde 2,1-aminomutase